MKRNYSRAIAAFLAAIMCLSVCIFSVYAVPGEDGEVTPDPGGDQSSAVESDVPYIPEPPAEGGDQSSAVESDIPYIPDNNGESSDDGGGGNGGSGGSGDYQTSYENDDTDDGGNNNVYYDGDGNSYSNQDDVYVGGGQSYQPPVSTAPTAALYDTDKKVDVNELSKGDWGDIANMLKNTGSSESDGDDFAFIQKNTSKMDNGHWIVIAGLLCILLSITGFIYLIASKIRRRKKIREGNITKTSDPQKKGAVMRSNDDYDDGYGSAKTTPLQPSSNKSEKTAATGHYGSGKASKGGKHGRRYR